MSWLGHIWFVLVKEILKVCSVGLVSAASPNQLIFNISLTGTRNLESELTGAYFPCVGTRNLENEFAGACKPHGIQF